MEALNKVAFIVFIMVIVILISLAGCGNRDIIHSNSIYNKAIVKVSDGSIYSVSAVN